MFITRKFHFHAAHRNETLKGDKCEAIHGHTYHVEVTFGPLEKYPDTGISVKFADLAAIVQPVIDHLDHSFLVHRNDPLFEILYPMRDKLGLKLVVFETPTSAENLAIWILGVIKGGKSPVYKISIQETTSSKVEVKAEDL